MKWVASCLLWGLLVWWVFLPGYSYASNDDETDRQRACQWIVKEVFGIQYWEYICGVKIVSIEKGPYHLHIKGWVRIHGSEGGGVDAGSKLYVEYHF